MRRYRDYLVERLADCEEAIVYLQTSIEEYQKDGDSVAFLIALQSIAKAQDVNLPEEIHAILATPQA
jgi:hypothetical protein